MKTNKYMLGTDFSHHNDINLLECGQQGFIFLKATEGVTFTDKAMNSFLLDLVARGHHDDMPYIGFYHYARPENGNSPSAEADHFISTIRPHIGNCMCALDIEDDALEYADIQNWALAWLNRVRAVCNTNPILYVQASSVNKFGSILAHFPLWVACYSQTSREQKYRKEVERAQFIQITSHPFDVDVFKGSPADIARIIKR